MREFYAITDSLNRFYNGAGWSEIMDNSCLWPVTQFSLQQLHDVAMRILKESDGCARLFIMKISVLRVSGPDAFNHRPKTQLGAI